MEQESVCTPQLDDYIIKLIIGKKLVKKTKFYRYNTQHTNGVFRPSY